MIIKKNPFTVCYISQSSKMAKIKIIAKLQSQNKCTVTFKHINRYL